MTTILSICLTVVLLSGILSLYRIASGPAVLDRAVGFDVLVACLTATVFLWGAMTGRRDVLIVIVILALTSFLSSTVISRFARPQYEETERRLTDDEQQKLDRLREQEEARFVNQESRLFERLWMRQRSRGGDDS